MPNKEEYLNDVCKEIRFRAARRVLREELAAHIDDKKAELGQSGAADAEADAIKAMGDAKATGKALNAVHKPRTEWGVILCVLLLGVAGYFAYWAGMSDYTEASALGSIITLHSNTHFIVWPAIVCLCALLTVYFLNYTWLRRLRHAAFFSALGYIAIRLYLDRQGVEAYGMRIFDGLFGQAAPIVISAMLFALSISGFIAHNAGKGIKGTVFIILLCTLSIAALYLLSSIYACVLGAVCIGMLAVSAYHKPQPQRMKWQYTAISSGAIIAVFILCVLLIKPDPTMFGTHFNDTFYKSEAVRDVLHYAKFIGSTAMRTHNATGYILTSVIGAYGWLAGIGIALAFAMLITLMIRRSMQIRHPYGRLLAFGVSLYFSARFVLFLLANLGVISGTSVNLPFVSYGWFNLITDMFLVGVFLSVWRRSSFMTMDIPAAFRKNAALRAE